MVKEEIKMLDDTLKIFDNSFYIKNEKRINIKLSQEELHASNVLLPKQVRYIYVKTQQLKKYSFWEEQVIFV